eukprot:PRCOL_00001190-RA
MAQAAPATGAAPAGGAGAPGAAGGAPAEVRPEFLVAWSNLVALAAGPAKDADEGTFDAQRDHPYADEAAFGGRCPVEPGAHVLVSDHEYEDVPTLASVSAVAAHADAPGGWLVKLHYAGCAYKCAQWVPVTKLAPPSAAEVAVRDALCEAVEAVTVDHLPGEAVTLRGGAFGRYSASGGQAERPRADLHCLVIDVAIRRGGCGLPFECWYRCETSDASMAASARALSLSETYRPPSADGSYDVRGDKVAAKGYVLQWYMAVEVSAFAGGPSATAAAEERISQKRSEAERLAEAARKAADALAAAEEAASVNGADTTETVAAGDGADIESAAASTGGSDEKPSSASETASARVAVTGLASVAKARATALAAADAADAAATAARSMMSPVSFDSKELFAESSLSRTLASGGSIRVALESYYDVYDHRAAALPIGCVEGDSGVAVALLSARSAGPALRVACMTVAESKRADRAARRALMSSRQRALHSLRWVACLAITALSFVEGPFRRAFVEPEGTGEAEGDLMDYHAVARPPRAPESVGTAQPGEHPSAESKQDGSSPSNAGLAEQTPPSESSASATAATETSPPVVTVKDGDSLWGILSAHCAPGTDVGAAIRRLRESGGIRGEIFPGDKIAMPEHVCQRRA